MLSGEELFAGEPSKETMTRETHVRSIVNSRISGSSVNVNFSEKALDVKRQMLHHDRHERLTLEIRDSFPDCFRTFASEPMLKKIARLAFAHLWPPCPAEMFTFQMLGARGFGRSP
eukprot:TRINITY_DN29910_c0_g1_i1.p1 TRINITY_DN29910_c0_g1~~TRINITY_DN29910_c0_g1_i1.p1  ORF type:complete len:116 (+),score=11.62 TRINITY_DN29910_c0_g1_i1:357-704(+)